MRVMRCVVDASTKFGLRSFVHSFTAVDRDITTDERMIHVQVDMSMRMMYVVRCTPRI